MARKKVVSKEQMIESAFSMLRKDGYEQITARKLSAYMNCSTQPIFHEYQSMADLLEDLYDYALRYYDRLQILSCKAKEIPFLELGEFYIQFALQDRYLFYFLFLSKHRRSRTFYEIVNGSDQMIVKEMKRAQEAGMNQAHSLFMNLWIFIHGAACMSYTGDYDLSGEETRTLIRDMIGRLTNEE